jgi:uncharacterized delta-60 repeat protein
MLGMRRTARLAGVLVLVSAFTATVCGVSLAAPGDLDRTFSGDGRVRTNFTADDDAASGLAIQSNGKIVVAGWAGWTYPRRPNFALARYKPDGTLDRIFGGDGKVTTRFTYDSVATAVAIRADKIVAVGETNGKFALARYALDGTLDPTFSGDGKARTLFFPLDTAAASDVVIQPDGKIVVVGTAWCEERFPPPGCDEEESRDIALARYDTDGTFDTSFGQDGKVLTDFTGNFTGNDTGSAVALQDDGKIVVAGAVEFPPDFALVRYNADGTLDLTFGEGGKVTTDIEFGRPDSVQDVAIQADGKIVAAGRTGGPGGGFGLARYNPDGTLDTTFSGDGKVRTDFTPQVDVAYGVAIQATGKIVAAGRASIDGGQFAVARYNSDGTLDTTFSANGKVTTNFSTRGDEAADVAIQADGRIVAAGRAGGEGGRFALARYRAG